MYIIYLVLFMSIYDNMLHVYISINRCVFAYCSKKLTQERFGVEGLETVYSIDKKFVLYCCLIRTVDEPKATTISFTFVCSLNTFFSLQHA